MRRWRQLRLLLTSQYAFSLLPSLSRRLPHRDVRHSRSLFSVRSLPRGCHIVWPSLRNDCEAVHPWYSERMLHLADWRMSPGPAGMPTNLVYYLPENYSMPAALSVT